MVLTDCRITPEIGEFFRSLAQARDSRVLELTSEYNPFSSGSDDAVADGPGEKSEEELFAAFYAERCGGESPSEEDLELLHYAGELLHHREHRDAGEQQDVQALLRFLEEQEERA